MLGEAQTSRPVSTAFEELTGIHHLLMGVLAGGFIRQQVVPLAGRKHCDLRLARHFQPVMVDNTFRDAAPAHQCAVVAEQHAGPSLEIVE